MHDKAPRLRMTKGFLIDGCFTKACAAPRSPGSPLHVLALDYYRLREGYASTLFVVKLVERRMRKDTATAIRIKFPAIEGRAKRTGIDFAIECFLYFLVASVGHTVVKWMGSIFRSTL